MSGEFGRYSYSGYINWALLSIAEDCLGHSDDERDNYEVTKLFGAVLEDMAGLAHDIAYLEAGDIGPQSAAANILEQLPALRKALDELEVHCQTQVQP